MSAELENLEAAARDFDLNADVDLVDAGRLASVVDRLRGVLCRVVDASRSRGDHLLAGQSPVSWTARQCKMSRNSAADHLCIGEQLGSMPRLAQALSWGEVGFQAASVICHLQERVGQIDSRIDEEMWITNAREFSIKDLRDIAFKTWHAVDPAGFRAAVEDAHERRQLFISQCGDMCRIDGWLEVGAGETVKTAIDALARPLGEDDDRSPKQRRADALAELAGHVLDQGLVPRRNGARPHISVHTTIEGLKGELGAAASELGDGTPICSLTVQHLACDGILHRVLKADSMVVDVGRAKRTAQPAHWRALKARHRTCAWAGCDRPVSWTQAHHIDFWENGGRTDLRRMLPLCFHHHRLVHEGGWHVVSAGERLEFVPPQRPFVRRIRGPGMRWAA